MKAKEILERLLRAMAAERFAESKLFAPRKAGNSFYASYTVDENGVGILRLNDMKYWLLGRKIERTWFCP